jgi:DNA-binding GntR family transcriptional regulator
VEELWDHAERYRLLHMRSGELTHHIRLVQADHAGILEAAEQRDAVGAAKRSAEHLARTALMTLVAIDPRHEPARVRTALKHVYAEDPTADGASAKSGARSAAAS